MDKNLKAEALSRIKDPKVREYYRAQLEMAEDLEDVRTGGIFDVPGVSESGTIETSVELRSRPRRPLSALVVPLAFVVLALAVAWWCSR